MEKNWTAADERKLELRLEALVARYGLVEVLEAIRAAAKIKAEEESSSEQARK